MNTLSLTVDWGEVTPLSRANLLVLTRALTYLASTELSEEHLLHALRDQGFSVARMEGYGPEGHLVARLSHQYSSLYLGSDGDVYFTDHEGLYEVVAVPGDIR